MFEPFEVEIEDQEHESSLPAIPFRDERITYENQHTVIANADECSSVEEIIFMQTDAAIDEAHIKNEIKQSVVEDINSVTVGYLNQSNTSAELDHNNPTTLNNIDILPNEKLIIIHVRSKRFSKFNESFRSAGESNKSSIPKRLSLSVTQTLSKLDINDINVESNDLKQTLTKDKATTNSLAASSYLSRSFANLWSVPTLSARRYWRAPYVALMLISLTLYIVIGIVAIRDSLARSQWFLLVGFVLMWISGAFIVHKRYLRMHQSSRASLRNLALGSNQGLIDQGRAILDLYRSDRQILGVNMNKLQIISRWLSVIYEFPQLSSFSFMQTSTLSSSSSSFHSLQMFRYTMIDISQQIIPLFLVGFFIYVLFGLLMYVTIHLKIINVSYVLLCSDIMFDLFLLVAVRTSFNMLSCQYTGESQLSLKYTTDSVECWHGAHIALSFSSILWLTGLFLCSIFYTMYMKPMVRQSIRSKTSFNLIFLFLKFPIVAVSVLLSNNMKAVLFVLLLIYLTLLVLNYRLQPFMGKSSFIANSIRSASLVGAIWSVICSIIGSLGDENKNALIYVYSILVVPLMIASFLLNNKRAVLEYEKRKKMNEQSVIQCYASQTLDYKDAFERYLSVNYDDVEADRLRKEADVQCKLNLDNLRKLQEAKEAHQRELLRCEQLNRDLEAELNYQRSLLNVFSIGDLDEMVDVEMFMQGLDFVNHAEKNISPITGKSNRSQSTFMGRTCDFMVKVVDGIDYLALPNPISAIKWTQLIVDEQSSGVSKLLPMFAESIFMLPIYNYDVRSLVCAFHRFNMICNSKAGVKGILVEFMDWKLFKSSYLSMADLDVTDSNVIDKQIVNHVYENLHATNFPFHSLLKPHRPSNQLDIMKLIASCFTMLYNNSSLQLNKKLLQFLLPVSEYPNRILNLDHILEIVNNTGTQSKLNIRLSTSETFYNTIDWMYQPKATLDIVKPSTAVIRQQSLISFLNLMHSTAVMEALGLTAFPLQ